MCVSKGMVLHVYGAHGCGCVLHGKGTGTVDIVIPCQPGLAGYKVRAPFDRVIQVHLHGYNQTPTRWFSCVKSG